MAREEQEKEDLLREATALIERAEWRVEGFPETVIAGFRRTGAASFFFSVDPVYQFNQAGELRRGYLDGMLIKAEAGGLARLRRVRVPGEVQLQRVDLNDSEVSAYLRQLDDHLDRLQACLHDGRYTLVGEQPTEGQIANRVLDWLQQRPRPTPIADRPHAT